MHFIRKNLETGSIIEAADWNFPGSEEVSYRVVRGCDGRLYKEGEEPTAPARDELILTISTLEAKQTPRRLREAALTDEGRAWLQNLEDQIEALRVELAKLA